jgi:uncharacterized membrane protein
MKNEKTIQKLNRIIFVLSLIGIIIAIYVTQSFIRKTSIVCVSSGCEIVRKSPASYPFGIPVPAFGLIGYSCIALLSFLRTTKERKELILIMFGLTMGGVGLVTWFTYTELFVIKGICMWCGISAVNMVVVFLLTLKSILLSRTSSKSLI